MELARAFRLLHSAVRAARTRPLNEASPLYAALLRASSLGYSQIGTGPLCYIRKLGKGYGWQGESVMLANPQCARTNGFTLNCARRIKPTARAELEQLISYVTRPPVSEKHLRLTERGNIELTLKRPFADGTRAVVFSPGEFLGRLAAICGAEVKKIAVITEPQAIRQLFEHFGIHGPEPPSKLSAFTNTGRDLTYHPL